MKKHLLLAFCLAAGAAVAVALAIAYFTSRPITAAAQSIPAPVQQQPGWVSPSPQFLADWDSYRALQAEIQKEQLKLQASGAVRKYQGDLDRANGMLTRLQQSVPNGFSFDPEKRYFLPAPKPAQTPQPPAPGAAKEKEPTK